MTKRSQFTRKPMGKVTHVVQCYNENCKAGINDTVEAWHMAWYKGWDRLYITGIKHSWICPVCAEDENILDKINGKVEMRCEGYRR